MSDFKNTLYSKCLQKWGDKQILKTIEELSELQKVLCKFLIGDLPLVSTCEEIADVKIMIEQLEFRLGLNKINVDKEYNFKIERLKQRVM